MVTLAKPPVIGSESWGVVDATGLAVETLGVEVVVWFKEGGLFTGAGAEDFAHETANSGKAKIITLNFNLKEIFIIMI